MPLGAQRLDNRIRDWLPALLTLRAEPMRMAIHTPRIPFLLNEWRTRIKRIAALRTEEVSCVPLGAARDNDLALDRRLARFTPWGEEFVEIEVAEEAWGWVGTVFVLKALHVVWCGVRGEVGDVFAALAGVNAGGAFGVLVLRLGVEGDAFEVLAALVAGKAFRVEARSAC